MGNKLNPPQVRGQSATRELGIRGKLATESATRPGSVVNCLAITE